VPKVAELDAVAVDQQIGVIIQPDERPELRPQKIEVEQADVDAVEKRIRQECRKKE
jgi:hypothetical protein